MTRTMNIEKFTLVQESTVLRKTNQQRLKL